MTTNIYYSDFKDIKGLKELFSNSFAQKAYPIVAYCNNFFVVEWNDKFGKDNITRNRNNFHTDPYKNADRIASGKDVILPGSTSGFISLKIDLE